MMTRFNTIKPALAASLLTLAAACGGGPSADNQSTVTTNIPTASPAASGNLMEPAANGAAEALPNAARTDEAPAATSPQDRPAPAAATKEKSRTAPAPAIREPAPAPKAAPRAAARNQAATRPAPAPEPAPAPKGTCTPEHRAMGHC